jgi:hypothetical protein
MTPGEWNGLMGTIIVVVFILANLAASIWGRD